MIPDGVVISFNGQIDFGTLVALLALALTLVQWIVSLIRGRRTAARSQASAICARVVRMPERETTTIGRIRIDFGTQVGLEVMNNSNDIVYQVILTAVLVQGAGPQDGRDVEGCNSRVLLSSVAPGKTVRCVGHSIVRCIRPSAARWLSPIATDAVGCGRATVIWAGFDSKRPSIITV